jgi:hypothetical protein
MVECPKCKKINDDDSVFCSKCGTPLKSTAPPTAEQYAKKFAQDMEQLGKNIGETFSQAAQRIQEESHHVGRHMEYRIDHASRHMENWYDRTFGILGPLLSSFIFLIILRLAIEIVKISANTLPDIDAITSVILLYLLPLFGISLLSNYTAYFARKSYKFRIFSPLLHSIAFVLILWVIAQILGALEGRLHIADLGVAATNIENLLPTVFVFVLLIGYVVLAVNRPRGLVRKP